MPTNRIEAFSDGVIAVIITIMVLELKVPRDNSLTSLLAIAPQFLAYLLSFLVVAIMWVNHHHLLHAARHADAACSGRTTTCFSGCRSSLSLPPTWATIIAIREPSQPTAWFSCYAASPSRFSAARFPATIGRIPNWSPIIVARWVRTSSRPCSTPPPFRSRSIDVRISFFIFAFVALSYFLPERKLAEPDARTR